MQETKEEHIKKMQSYSPYDNAWTILDTDYDNYLFLYACQEIEEKVN